MKKWSIVFFGRFINAFNDFDVSMQHTIAVNGTKVHKKVTKGITAYKKYRLQQ